MTDTQPTFEAITETLCAEDADVAPGKMMRSPGITWGGKVFAFHYDGAMVFRLGKRFDADGAGLTGWSYLSPFKHKPPMTGWIVVPDAHTALWPDLARQARDVMKAERSE